MPFLSSFVPRRYSFPSASIYGEACASRWFYTSPSYRVCGSHSAFRSGSSSERATLRASEHVPSVLLTPVQHRVHINVERYMPRAVTLRRD